MDVPAEPPAEHLEDELARSPALRVAHPALAGVLGDARKARGETDRALGRCAERPVAHRRDHHRHRELERVGAVQAADLGPESDLRHHVRVLAGPGDVAPERKVGKVREGARATVAADPVAPNLRLDVDVFLDLRVPVLRGSREGEEGNAAHLSLARRVAQLLARVGDLGEGTREAQLVAVEEGADVVVLALVEVDLLGVGAEILHLAADEDVPAGHVLSDLLAGVAENDDAPAVHHVPGHEVGVARAGQRARLHHLPGPRPHVAVDDDLGPADRDPGNGAGVATHHDPAGVHVVADAPAHVVVDLEARGIREPGAEVAGRAANAHVDGVHQPHAEVMAGVRVDELDVRAVGAVLAYELVRLANRGVG